MPCANHAHLPLPQGLAITDWEDKMQEFRHFALRREGSLHMVAEECHIGRETVKRIMAGELKNPRPSVRECVNRFVEAQKGLSDETSAEG